MWAIEAKRGGEMAEERRGGEKWEESSSAET